MEKKQTPIQQILTMLSLVILVPPVFYLIVVKGGMYYSAVVPSMLLATLIVIPIFIGVAYLAEKSPFLLIGINVVVGCLLYYFFMIWEMYPVRAELRYQADKTVLKGNVQSYQENHYLLSGSVDKPKKGRLLSNSTYISFDKNGNAVKDSSIYREDFLEKPNISVNHYTYSRENQLVYKNFQDADYTYTYNNDGQCSKVEKTAMYHRFKGRGPWRKEETTRYLRDSTDYSLTIETTELRIDLDGKGDTSTYFDTEQHLFNEQWQVLYKGDVKNDTFRYDEKYTYNAKNQLVEKIEIGYKEINYNYDENGYLKTEATVWYGYDSTSTKDTKKIEYDVFGYKLYEKTIRNYQNESHMYYPQLITELFYENEYDKHQNLVRQVVFIKENEGKKRPYYLVEIDLEYYD